ALFMRMSTSRLSSASAAVSLRSTCHGSPPTSSAIFAAASPSRSAMTTCAPARANARTHAAPIPLAPPVTRAFLPVRSVIVGPSTCLLLTRALRTEPALDEGHHLVEDVLWHA